MLHGVTSHLKHEVASVREYQYSKWVIMKEQYLPFFPVAAETQLPYCFREKEEVRKIILTLTKSGVHSLGRMDSR